RKGLSQNPNDGTAMHNLAECLRRLGDPKKEVPKLKQRMEQLSQDHRRLDDLKRNKLVRQPFDPDLCYEIGTIYNRMGEETQAAQWFARALKYDQNHQKALRAAINYLEKMGDKEKETVADLRARLRVTGSDLSVV